MLSTLIGLASLTQIPIVEAVTFASEPGVVYMRANTIAKRFGWKYEYDPVTEIAKINGSLISVNSPRLSDGTWLVSTKDLTALGARCGALAGAVDISYQKHRVRAHLGAKRVLIDLSGQTMTAWQGDQIVISCPVSTGTEGKETPDGRFLAGKKEKMHISTIYHTPMPFSVHVVEGIFIHGSDRFSFGPGSHGCIRLSLQGVRNDAEWFYNWVAPGTPVTIRGRWHNVPASAD